MVVIVVVVVFISAFKPVVGVVRPSAERVWIVFQADMANTFQFVLHIVG